MTDGIPTGTNVPINKLPGHDPKLERRAAAVQALQKAVGSLYGLAAGKKGAEELHAQISKYIDDFASFRV